MVSIKSLNLDMVLNSWEILDIFKKLVFTLEKYWLRSRFVLRGPTSAPGLKELIKIENSGKTWKLWYASTVFLNHDQEKTICLIYWSRFLNMDNLDKSWQSQQSWLKSWPDLVSFDKSLIKKILIDTIWNRVSTAKKLMTISKSS
jgi:hypothetical protein